MTPLAVSWGDRTYQHPLLGIRYIIPDNQLSYGGNAEA